MSARDKVKLKIRWEATENPEVAAASLAIGLARVLRPDAFRLSRDATAALVSARKIIGTEPKRADRERIEREMQDLEARLAALKADLEAAG